MRGTPDAEVFHIETSAHGVRTLVATCPHGRAVRHGGGFDDEPISKYLGSRTSHAPCCPRYRLVLSQHLREAPLKPSPEKGTTPS